MKSQRRNSQSQKKSQRKSKSSRNNQNQNQNQRRNSQSQNRNNQTQNRAVQKKSQNKTTYQRKQQSKNLVKRRNQKQRKSRNQRKKKRNQRLRSRRQNRSKQAQKGGYSGLDFSILPCETSAQGVSVPNFNSTADASTRICSDSVDSVTDAEYGVGSGASVLSGLSDFVRGETTQVINERDANSGDGLTDEERRQSMDNRADESTYRRIFNTPENSRSVAERQTLQVLGNPSVQDARWSRLTDAGLTGYYDREGNRYTSDGAGRYPAQFPEEYNLPQ